MKSIVELGEAARRCSNKDYQATMRRAIADYIGALERLSQSPNAENMMTLNGSWAHAKRVLDNTPPEAPPAPNAGAPEAPMLAMAA
jgi:hypothetical protein